eukprot:230692_1
MTPLLLYITVIWCSIITFCARAQGLEDVSIIVGDVSFTSAVTGNDLLILLTKEKFTCSASLSIEFNETAIDTSDLLLVLGTNSATLYYKLTANDEILETGSILVETGDEFPSSIDLNEVSVDETGTLTITMHVSFVESFETTSDDAYSGSSEMFCITGFTTLVPLIFVVFLAVTLKNVYVSLYLAIWIGSFIVSGCSFRYAFEMSLGTYILGSAASEEHQFVILFTVFLSGLVFLIQRSGGTQGFSSLVSKLAVSAKRTQFATFLAGLVFFFDDYANALVVGSTFRPLTDMYHISREKLAFLVDGTSAPDASIVPLSSWVGFELQQIQQQLDAIKEGNGGVMPEGLTDNAFVFFVITIPTRFYPIYLLLFQVITISLSLEFGPMLIAERLCRVDERTDGGKGKAKVRDPAEVTEVTTDEQIYSGAAPAKDTPARWWNMVIPIVCVIVLLLACMINSGAEGVEADGEEMTARNIFAYSDPWGSLLYGTFGASLVTIALYLVQFKYKGNIVPPTMASCKHCVCPPKRDENVMSAENPTEDEEEEEGEDVAVPLVPFTEAIEFWIQGIAFMAPAVAVLVLVWAIGAIMTDIGADRYFTRIVNDGVDPNSLPTLTFILAALISAATGTSWGTMTIMFPLISPAAWAICEPLDNGVFLYTVTLSQILSGAIFGDHASPLSDTTLLSSVATQCDLFRHVWTQMPYAVWVAFWSVLCGTAMVGDGIPSGWCLVVGVIVLTITTWLVSAPVLARSGRYDVFTELYIFCLNKCGGCKKKEDVKNDAEQERDLSVLKNRVIDYVKQSGREDHDWLLRLFKREKEEYQYSSAKPEHIHLQGASGVGQDITEKAGDGNDKDDDLL